MERMGVINWEGGKRNVNRLARAYFAAITREKVELAGRAG
jgi:hypothetical protein